MAADDGGLFVDVDLVEAAVTRAGIAYITGLATQHGATEGAIDLHGDQVIAAGTKVLGDPARALAHVGLPPSDPNVVDDRAQAVTVHHLDLGLELAGLDLDVARLAQALADRAPQTAQVVR